MAKDDIYKEPKQPLGPFEFNEGVVRVFDDMIHRSVPGYDEIIRRQAQLSACFYQPGTFIYDLGCSTGNFGLCLSEEMAGREFQVIAVDNSLPMLQVYKKRRDSLVAFGQHIHLVCADLRALEMQASSVVVVNLTLQFLPVAERVDLLQKIYRSLAPGGVLLLTEKVVHENPFLAELEQQFYYRFKKERGYSELEISQKREALENVLIPETLEQHQSRLLQIGFRQQDVWFKWFNFAALLCRKESA